MKKEIFLICAFVFALFVIYNYSINDNIDIEKAYKDNTFYKVDAFDQEMTKVELKNDTDLDNSDYDITLYLDKNTKIRIYKDTKTNTYYLVDLTHNKSENITTNNEYISFRMYPMYTTDRLTYVSYKGKTIYAKNSYNLITHSDYEGTINYFIKTKDNKTYYLLESNNNLFILNNDLINKTKAYEILNNATYIIANSLYTKTQNKINLSYHDWATVSNVDYAICKRYDEKLFKCNIINSASVETE